MEHIFILQIKKKLRRKRGKGCQVFNEYLLAVYWLQRGERRAKGDVGGVKVPEEPEYAISSLSHGRAEERSQGRLVKGENQSRGGFLSGLG